MSIFLLGLINDVQAQYPPHRLKVSIDSVTNIDSTLYPFINKYFIDSVPSVVGKRFTDYISNTIQSVAVECGFEYIPNYKNDDRVKTDLQVTLKLIQGKRHPFAYMGEYLDVTPYFQVSYSWNNQEKLLHGFGKYIKAHRADRWNYIEFFPNAQESLFRLLSGLYNPANKIYDVNYQTSSKVIGIENWIESSEDIDESLIRAITLGVEQAILHRMLYRYRKQGKQTMLWSPNYRKTLEGKKKLDYILSGTLVRKGNYLDLRYEWKNTNTGEVTNYNQILINEIEFKRGNYVDLVVNSFDLFTIHGE